MLVVWHWHGRERLGRRIKSVLTEDGVERLVKFNLKQDISHVARAHHRVEPKATGQTRDIRGCVRVGRHV